MRTTAWLIALAALWLVGCGPGSTTSGKGTTEVKPGMPSPSAEPRDSAKPHTRPHDPG
jgi:hypothetical protein